MRDQLIGALGGLVLALGDYPALGFVALAWLLSAAGLLVWSRPHEAAGEAGTAA